MLCCRERATAYFELLLLWLCWVLAVRIVVANKFFKSLPGVRTHTHIHSSMKHVATPLPPQYNIILLLVSKSIILHTILDALKLTWYEDNSIFITVEVLKSL